MSFCGEKRFLTSIKLAKRSARRPTQDISQAFLINSVVLQNVELKYPPSILASLPLLIRNPENLKYNRGIPATKETIDAMIDLTYYQSPCLISYLYPDGTTEDVEFAAKETIYDVCQEFIDESGLSPKDVLLVRQMKDNSELRIPLCNMPIGLFYVEGARYSFELRYLPKTMKLTKSNILMLKLYFLQRSNEFEAESGVKEAVFNAVEKFLNVSPANVEREEKRLDLMLNDIYTKPKYQGFIYRTFTTGEVNIIKFIVQEDGRVMTQKNSLEPVYFKARDLNIKNDKDGMYLIFGEKAFFVPMYKRDRFYEFINLAYMTIWEEVPYHEFDFECPARTESVLPRVFEDSKANKIKQEYLQQVIEEQIQLGEKFTKKQ